MRQKNVPTLTIILIAFLFGFSGCESEKEKQPIFTIKGRWFTKQQFDLGQQVYTENCSRCHGQYGEGIVENWKKPNPDGSFPPPPLNGTAHTWHHPFSILMKTINEGGAPVGGNMPAFADSIAEEEKIAVIAYFQSLWDDQTYRRWVKMNSEQ